MKRVVVGLLGLALAGAADAAAQPIQNIVLRNSFNPLGAGARGLGMGGAFIAVADDGTAASFNPAGLAQLRRTEIAAVGFNSELTSTLSIPRIDSIETQSTKTSHGAPDFFGIAVPFEAGGRHWTGQLSYQRSVDLFGEGRAEFATSVPLRDLLTEQERADALRVGVSLDTLADVFLVVEPEQSGAFHTVTGSLAAEVTPRLSLGLSLNYWIADWTATGRTTVAATLPLPGLPAIPLEVSRVEFEQIQSFRGLNLNLGFMLRYPWISLGGVLRAPFAADYNLDETDVEESFTLGEEPELETLTPFMRSRIQWPRGAGLGVAIRPLRGLTLAADYSRSLWSRATIENVPEGALLTATSEASIEGEEPRLVDRNFFDLAPASQTTTGNTDQWRVGAEYLVTTSKVIIPLRGGWFRDRSPVADFSAEQGRESDGFTLGTGLNFNRFVFDVAWEHRESDGVVGLRLGRARPGTEAPSVQATTEKVKQDRVVASIIYRFGGDDDPLKKLFGSIFGRSEEELDGE